MKINDPYYHIKSLPYTDGKQFPAYFIQEIFKPIYIERFNYLLISNYGRLFDSSIKYFINPLRDENGFEYITIPTSKNNCATLYIHDLVGHTFLEEGLWITEVQHKDCNPLNNMLGNLYLKRAVENEYWFNKKTKHLICYFMANGLKNREIASNLGLVLDKKLSDLFEKVRKKKLWVDVSEFYNIPSESVGREYTENDFRIMAESILNGASPRDVAGLLNREYTNSFKNTYSRFKHGKVRKDLAIKYGIIEE